MFQSFPPRLLLILLVEFTTVDHLLSSQPLSTMSINLSVWQLHLQHPLSNVCIYQYIYYPSSLHDPAISAFPY